MSLAHEEKFSYAKPVWAKGLEEERNITLGLYKRIFCEKGNAVLKITCSGFYKIYLNGGFYYFGPARCAHGYFRVDEIELPLKKGENHIAIKTVNYYVKSFYSLRQKGFISAELTHDGDLLAATGAAGEKAFRLFTLSERIRKVQRYSYQRPFAEAYRLSEDYCGWMTGEKGSNASETETVITGDKNFLKRNLPHSSFEKAFPCTKIAVGRVKTGVIPAKYRKDRSLVNIDGPEYGYKESELEVHLSDEIQELPAEIFNTENTEYDGITVVDGSEFEIIAFRCEKTGFISAEITCFDDGILYFTFDEILNGENDIDPLRLDCCNVIKISAHKGKYRFISEEPVGFKFIKILCACGKFEVKNLSVIQTVCPVPLLPQFKSGDERLDEIISAARESFVQNSFDLFTDCPTRERAGWLCDSFFLGRAEKTLTGQNLTERNFLENYLLPKSFPNIPEGMLPMCYPSDSRVNEYIPNWAMWFILELKDYRNRTGDNDFISLFNEKIHSLLAWFAKYENSDGLLEHLPGWVFVEWSKANEFVQDINFPSNMLYSMTLAAAAELLGDKALYEKSVRLKETVRKRSFDGEFFRDNEVISDGKAIPTDNRSETCQYYAFFTGIATREEYPLLWSTLAEKFGPDRAHKGGYPGVFPSNAFIGNFLRLELLCRYGMYEQLLKEIKGYFLYMAERTGTLWEHIDTFASCNHGFAAYVSSLIVIAAASDLKHISIKVNN